MMHKVRENTRAASGARSGQILRFSVMAGHDNSNVNTQQNTFGTESNLAWSRIMNWIPHFSEMLQHSEFCISKPESLNQNPASKTSTT